VRGKEELGAAGARGKGSGGARWTPVRCTATELMVHSSGDETAQRGGVVQGRDHSSEDEAVLNFPVRRVQAGRRRGRWSEVTAVKPYAAREMEWLTGGVSLSAGVSVHAERAGVCEGAGQRWAERGERSRAQGERGRGCGPGIGPAKGERFLPFFISNFYFPFLFLSPFLLNN
jgi:hypothetical protein